MSLFFSVIIPTYNRAHLVCDAIQSVLNQTYQLFEILVIDDGSTDDTKEKIAQIKDPRVRYFYKVNEERGVARNFGTNRSSGDYITFLDSDDLLYPQCLEKCNEYLLKDPEIKVLHVGYELRDFEGTLIRIKQFKTKYLNKILFEGNNMSCICTFLEANVAKLYQFNTNPALVISEDWELWLRLSARYKIYYFKDILGCMREHPGRSLNTFDLGKKMYLTECLLISLRNDDAFMEKYGNKMNKVESELVSMMALDLAVSKNNTLSLSFFWESLVIYPGKIMARRTLAIFKIIFLNYFKSFFNTGSK